MIGTTLGHYRIEEKIGAGGMGEVYRATDTKLGREVAIKVLPEAFAADPERLARFDQEARLLASLNHPNIAAIYGLEEAVPVDASGGVPAGDRPAGAQSSSEPAGPVRYLVLELVPGETLAERIAGRPLPVDEALQVCCQIAEALEAAHERGIIHRDLKPANVKVTPDGKVKVLDFGLAKAFETDAAAGTDLSQSPTVSFRGSREGVILGTAAYMSPEQARGKPLDKRTDIWSFGCVLYETLTGKQAFHGETASDTISAILRGEPDWELTPSGTPPTVRRLLARCLAKDPRSRLRDIGDAWIELESVRQGTDGVAAAETPPRTSSSTFASRLLWVTGGLALALGILIGTLLRSKDLTDTGYAAPTHVSLAPRPGVELRYLYLPTLAISPDGRRIAYVGSAGGQERLFLQDLARGEPARPIPGSEEADIPFFSPDGQWLGFAAGTALKKIPIHGGEAKHVVEVSASHPGASWSTDDTILFVPRFRTGIQRVRAEGGSPEPATVPVDAADGHAFPQILPDGEHVLYTITGNPPRIAVGSLNTKEETIIYEGGFYARYVPTGHILFAQSDTLMAMPFDLTTLRAGQPLPVLQGLITNRGEVFAEFAISETGSLVYLEGSSERERWLVRLAPNRPPERLNETPRPFEYVPLNVSPDGRHVALSMDASDLWLFDMERRDLSVRLTADPLWEWHPVWMPDGLSLTYVSDREGMWAFFSQPVDGIGGAKKILINEFDKWPGSWSPDGKTFIYSEAHSGTGIDLWVYSTETPDEPRPFLRSVANEFLPVFSPDGRWVAYRSDESGQDEIYVVSYPELHTKRKVSRDGGNSPRWSADGTRIYFQWTDWVMVSDFVEDRGVTTSLPERFVKGVDSQVYTWDVAHDGSHVIALERRRPPQLRLVLNWFEELKRLVPTGKN